MAGFFGLFGGNKNKGSESKEAFFLSEDDAKTFGDIDYMRKEVVVRRTFAKKKGLGELESVKSVSSSASKNVGDASYGVSTSSSTESVSESKPATSQAPKFTKKTGSGMDMFRNMAKDIRR